MSFRPEFENEIPIDDELVVLDLLVRRWNDRTTREIVRVFADGPYVEIHHCRDFSYDTIYRFKVTDRVADALLAGHYAAGKPQWGYTDMKHLEATEVGQIRLWQARKAAGLEEDRLTTEWWFTRRNMDRRATAAKAAVGA